LLPSLRRQKTPAFNSLIDDLRANPNLTVQQARQEAATYSKYFRDICTLTVEASCQVPAPTLTVPDQSRWYLFARAKDGTLYWSSYNPENTASYDQTFWDIVPGIQHARRIIGAIPYLPSDDQHQILLFVKTSERGSDRLLFIIYDLLTQSWSGDAIELDLPTNTKEFTAIVEQRYEGRRPPNLLILPKGEDTIYMRVLNHAAQGWEETDFRTLNDFKTGQPVKDIQDIYSLEIDRENDTIGGGIGIGLLFVRTSTSLSVGEVVLSGRVSGRDPFVANLQYPLSPLDTGTGTATWLGSTNLLSSSLDGALVYVRNDTTNTVLYEIIDLAKVRDPNPITLSKTGPAELVSLAAHAGYREIPVTSPNTIDVPQAAQLRSGASSLVFTISTFPAFDVELSSKKVSIAPNLIAGPFDITEQFSGSDLQTRRTEIQNAFTIVLADPIAWPFNQVYLQEAYYFVPVQLALQLEGRGEYIAALDWFRTVYDYSVPLALRKIYYGLTLEESLPSVYQRGPDWLLDPLNPHTIAATRANTYTRYTIMSIIRCLVDFADAEFTRDTSESVPRADILYTTALELFDTPELKQNPSMCQQLINTLRVQIDDPQWVPVWRSLQQELAGIDDSYVLTATIGRVKAALATNGSWALRFAQARTIIAQAKGSLPASETLGTVIQEDASRQVGAQTALLRAPTIFDASQQIGATVGTGLLHAVSNIAKVPLEKLEQEGIALPSLHNHAVLLPQNGLPAASKTPPDPATAASLSLEELINNYANSYFASPPSSFCVPTNQVLAALRTHAELNLYKLRHCRNIAGQEHQLDPYAAQTASMINLQTTGTNGTVTLLPTPYRYSALIERAKQLAQLAAQAEAAMLSALEKHDAEAYNLLKARQDVSLTSAQVQLQSLRVQEALDGGQLATLQQAKAQAQKDHYQSLVDNGDSDYEKAALGFQIAAVVHLHTAAALTEAGTFGFGGIGEVGNALAATSSLLQTQASYERRNQEWEFQLDLAKKDVSIAAQQGTIAQDNVQIANQEQTIAVIQADHAAAIVDFLANKFTNAQLYEWMSTILQRVYSFFLQQATVMAQLAANQLAFERQQVPPPYIQADYWEAPSASGVSANATNGNAPDRRGLTGSARLLQDIYQLDQYAFLTNTRKLQLTKTISLAQLAPAEFQHFLETGVLTFATPMTMFDSEFPGHYLRLIKRVRLSVIALIPPTLGIRATLSTTGTSRVVIPGSGFQSVVVRREPVSVALSSPNNATGLFVDLDPQPDMLLPFEDSGVDTNWELSMPRAANQFDFRTIADVLITIDYTALDSPDYRQQIVQKLNARPIFQADRPFSFRNDLADQWYDLHNPDQTATPMVVSFTTQRDDFPPNITDLRIQQVVLYFAFAEGYSFVVSVTLSFTEQGSTVPVGGPALSVDGIISTRTGSAGSWISMLGKSPIGQWDLAFPETFLDGQKASDVFKKEEIEDILFVITFSGRTPEWPV
jgi:Tc toxin complex TcA C-terminal TcB-binding domain